MLWRHATELKNNTTVSFVKKAKKFRVLLKQRILLLVEYELLKEGRE
jgi:hypothetical protein